MGDVEQGEVAGLDERFDAALASAELYPLLCAVAHLTGDLSLLREDLALDQSQLLVPEHGLTPEQDAEARRLVGDAVRAHIRAETSSAAFPAPTTAPPLSPEDCRRIFDFLVGRESTPAWEAFLTEELALEGTDPRADVERLRRRRHLPLCRRRCRRLRARGGAQAAPGRGGGDGFRQER